MRMNKVCVALLCCLLSIGLGAEEAKQDKKGPGCRKEFKKFCQEVQKGEGRKIECLIKNKSNFSSECQQRVAEIEQKYEKMQACKKEMDSLCPKTEDRKERRKCMKENKDKISQSCKDLHQQRKDHRKQRKIE